MDIITVPFHMWASKQAAGFNECRKIMKRYGFLEAAQCPYCGPRCEVEETDHILFSWRSFNTEII